MSATLSNELQGAADPLPPIQPMASELLAALACVMLERDALRIKLGMTVGDGRQEFSPVELRRGDECNPTATLDNDGRMVVRCDAGRATDPARDPWMEAQL